MKLFSFIGESHMRVEGYSTENLTALLSSDTPSRIIVAVDPQYRMASEGYASALQSILEAPGISEVVCFAHADESRYGELRDSYLKQYSESAESIVKKNILEMIDATVRSYLEGYWKGNDTVNSEVTDSLFRAKHKLVSTMFWDMERDTWNSMMEEMTEKILRKSPGSDDVILVDVEKRYWLMDRLDLNDV